MKIAYIFPSLDNQGPVVAGANLIKSLMPHVDLIDVYYFKPICNISMPVPSHQISFFHDIDFAKYDVIHSYGALPDLYLAKNRRKINSKVASSMHNFLSVDLGQLYNPVKSFLYRKLWLLALRYHKNIVVSSNSMKKYYEKLFFTKKHYSIIEYGIEKKVPNKISSYEDKVITDFKSNRILIGSVGLLIKRKGFHQLISFLKNNPSYAVMIIGDGEEKEALINLSELYGVSDQLLLLGYKDNSVDYYSYFDIYGMVSYSEGCSLAMIEAMSQNVPIVCSDIPNHRDCVSSEEVSYFTLDSQSSLENAIFLASKHLSFAENSYKRYLNTYSLEAMAEKHIKFYRELV